MENLKISVNENGLMLLDSTDDNFSVNQIDLPDSWGLKGNDAWLKGLPINIKLLDSNEELEGSVVQLSVNGKSDLMNAFVGPRSKATVVQERIRALWMQANGMDAPAASKPTIVEKREVVSKSATTAPETNNAFARKALMVSGTVCAAAILLGAGYFAANRFMKVDSAAPSLDLSQLSLEQVANIDANPALIANIQQNMIGAVQFGAKEAEKMTSELGEQHINVLKSLGLDPGVSIENATACLSSMHR